MSPERSLSARSVQVAHAVAAIPSGQSGWRRSRPPWPCTGSNCIPIARSRSDGGRRGKRRCPQTSLHSPHFAWSTTSSMEPSARGPRHERRRHRLPVSQDVSDGSGGVCAATDPRHAWKPAEMGARNGACASQILRCGAGESVAGGGDRRAELNHQGARLAVLAALASTVQMCTAPALGVVFFYRRQVGVQQVSPTQCASACQRSPALTGGAFSFSGVLAALVNEE
jgi:hypothetical protein